MRAKALIIYCFLVCLSTLARAQVGLSPDEQKLFNLINQERKKAGLPQFQWDYHLAESARAHTQLMAERNVLTHQFKGEPPLGERLGSTGARFDGAAENVAQGDMTADVVSDVHESLMYSPEHRGNILNAQYNAVGLAVISRAGEMYVTEDFARTLQAYSDAQFRDAVVAAFNRARRTRGWPPLIVLNDPQLHDLACSENDKPEIPQGLSTALDEVVFTSSDPEKLPSNMQKAVSNPALHRMSLGACFHPDKQHGYANFWVIVAFYP